MEDILLVKDGGDIISMVKLQAKVSQSYLEYLKLQVAKDFNEYVKEHWGKDDYEFDKVYAIIDKYEPIDTITPINSYIIDLDMEVE